MVILRALQESDETHITWNIYCLLITKVVELDTAADIFVGVLHRADQSS